MTPFKTLFKRPAAIGLLAVAAAVLSGCASTPAPTLLTLPAAVAARPATANPALSPVVQPAPMPVLALSRVDAPEYIVSRRVRYRTDSSTLAEWPDTYWAERIEVSLSRELVAALRQQLPGWSICEANCAEASPAAAMRVVLNRMDYTRGDRTLRANVRIVVTTADLIPRGLHDRELSYEIAGGADSAQAQARAYADLLARVAVDASSLVGAPAAASVPGSAPGSAAGERPRARP